VSQSGWLWRSPRPGAWGHRFRRDPRRARFL